MRAVTDDADLALYSGMLYLFITICLCCSGCKANLDYSVRRVIVTGEIVEAWPGNSPNELYLWINEDGQMDKQTSTICQMVLNDDTFRGQVSFPTFSLDNRSIANILSADTALTYAYEHNEIGGIKRSYRAKYQLADLSTGLFIDITPADMKEYIAIVLAKRGVITDGIAWYDEAHGLYLLISDPTHQLSLLAGKDKLERIGEWAVPYSTGGLFWHDRYVNAVLDDTAKLYAYSYDTGNMEQCPGYENLCQQILSLQETEPTTSGVRLFTLAKGVAIVPVSGGLVVLKPEGEIMRLHKASQPRQTPPKTWPMAIPVKKVSRFGCRSFPISETQLGVLDAKTKVVYIFE